eukprot:CAMPEP_0204088448 /NCGR_PEP_ID=MMETSP0360-20130528/186206_1 /ASSEMBLY_ACC=CAM_ASM_000342 /TAXON_ID=268821 /ORGANISM="Scrippsiella Hangoei, Strain SHTV-5" /LENGTH=31 /DNA_ID= /DNA_START= /DNA_END= /DNA_ORIENTATION=
MKNVTSGGSADTKGNSISRGFITWRLMQIVG